MHIWYLLVYELKFTIDNSALSRFSKTLFNVLCHWGFVRIFQSSILPSSFQMRQSTNLNYRERYQILRQSKPHFIKSR